MTMKTIRTKSVKETEAILKAGAATVKSIEDALAQHFPFAAGDLSKAEASFQADLEANGLDSANTLLSASIPATRDLLSLGIANIATLERFIALHVPQMEDGNNFGVTVQMTVAKHLKETRDELSKKLEAVPAYYATRAEAVEKLGLPKTSTSQTKTESKSDSTGGKDGDESKTSTSVVKEEKESNGSKVDCHRSKAILAIDVQCYHDLSASLDLLLTGYATVLDNMQKNWDKIEAPKGGASNSMGMY